MYRFLAIVFLALYLCGRSSAQEGVKIDSVPPLQDTLRTAEDSLKYKAIEDLSKKSKFTRFIHSLLFKPLNEKVPREAGKRKPRKVRPKVKVEGKIVRQINITTLDPFGYSVRDTSKHPGGFLMKTGNILHIKTQNIIIKNLLLFKVNRPYDSLLVKESERLIRSQRYVQDVSLNAIPVSKKSDSVDVFIRVMDVWSLIPALQVSKTSADFGFTDNNLAGLGATFQGDTHIDRVAGKSATRISYLVPNIRNTYISMRLQFLITDVNSLIEKNEFSRSYYSTISSNLPYTFSGNHALVRSFELAREFYSPVTKWAGGIFTGQVITAQSYIEQDTLRYLSARTNIQDLWGARAWQLFRGHREQDRTTNLIFSLRALRIRYPEQIAAARDFGLFNGENIYFAGLGISSRGYARDRYIFSYGKIEDVPLGRVFGLTVGYEVQNKERMYFGIKAAWGNYFKFGYLSAHFEYGTFIGRESFQQEVILARINYYTRLLNLGGWKLRQFARPTMILGIKRKPGDNLSFGDLMKGFGETDAPAQHLLVLALQTQSYAPWNLAGFHFGPYLFASFGLLGTEASGFSNSRLYSLLGFGLLIRNEYLMFNTFQISLAFYPYIPGSGYNIFKANAYKTNNYGFLDFDISKPKIADYR
jgi:hypothetical protein